VDKRLHRGQATRLLLITTATRLFTEEGYEGTSIELVLQECGISRGALYHHFVNKEALFEAVLEEVEGHIVQQVSSAALEAPNPFEALRAGCATWLKLAHDPTIKQIVLIDAPSVVGWAAWRELDNRYVLGLLKAGLSRAAAEGWGNNAELVDIHAHMLLATLTEVALLIARSQNVERIIQNGQAVIDQFLRAIMDSEPKGH
jgi:AcrR family transcriptional regulator